MSITVTEFPLNRRESFKAVISDRAGLLVVSLGRWKIDANGVSHRAGPTFEFAAHRLDGIAELIADVQRIIGDRAGNARSGDAGRASA
jgi:hypothetical protein